MIYSMEIFYKDSKSSLVQMEDGEEEEEKGNNRK
jgi:hypothetical protein